MTKMNDDQKFEFDKLAFEAAESNSKRISNKNLAFDKSLKNHDLLFYYAGVSHPTFKEIKAANKEFTKDSFTRNFNQIIKRLNYVITENKIERDLLKSKAQAQNILNNINESWKLRSKERTAAIQEYHVAKLQIKKELYLMLEHVLCDLELYSHFSHNSDNSNVSGSKNEKNKDLTSVSEEINRINVLMTNLFEREPRKSDEYKIRAFDDDEIFKLVDDVNQLRSIGLDVKDIAKHINDSNDIFHEFGGVSLKTLEGVLKGKGTSSSLERIKLRVSFLNCYREDDVMKCLSYQKKQFDDFLLLTKEETVRCKKKTVDLEYNFKKLKEKLILKVLKMEKEIIQVLEHVKNDSVYNIKQIKKRINKNLDDELLKLQMKIDFVNILYEPEDSSEALNQAILDNKVEFLKLKYQLPAKEFEDAFVKKINKRQRRIGEREFLFEKLFKRDVVNAYFDFLYDRDIQNKYSIDSNHDSFLEKLNFN